MKMMIKIGVAALAVWAFDCDVAVAQEPPAELVKAAQKKVP